MIDSILNAFFSYTGAALIPFLFILGFILQPKATKPPKKKLGIAQKIILVFIIATLLTRCANTKYGAVTSFQSLQLAGDKIVGIDEEIWFGKGRAATRVHVMDAKTGERIFYSGNFANKYFWTDSSITAWKLSEENHLLIKKLPSEEILLDLKLSDVKELQSILARKDKVLVDDSQTIQIIALNGEHFYFDPLARRFKNNKQENIQNKQETKGFEIVSEGKLHYIQNQTTQKIINPNNPFFPCHILHVNENEQIIVMSSTTKERERVYGRFGSTDYRSKSKDHIISAMSPEGKLLWQKKAIDFVHTWDMYNLAQEPRFTQSFIFEDKLLLFYGGFLYQLQLSDGKIISENRF